MVLKKIIYLVLIAVFISSCGIFSDDLPFDKKALTYKNQFVFDNQFRMNGMYLTYFEKDKYWSLRYFFQNGSYFSVAIDESNSDYSFLKCWDIHQREREIPYYWGCFIVEDNILKIQTFDATSLNYSTKYRVKERWAEIVNDTTIHFFKEIRRGQERELDETFHFRHCENKPDSTNILMRN